MRNFIFLLFICLGTFVQASEAGAPGRVIVLSWDGMRHDFPDRGNFPGLKRVETEGIRAGRLTPVFPSSTFPGHVSLATGVPPNVHGILNNVFYDREDGMYAYNGEAHWLQSEPVWATAERQGVKAATYFWVGSETDWHDIGTSYRMAPFDGSRSEEDKVAKIIEWLDLPAAEQPRLIMSYWAGADTMAHVKGPDHPDVVDQISSQDEQLQVLLKAIDDRDLWPTTTLIIVSDHGMTNVNKSAEIRTATEDSGIDVKVVGGSTIQHLFLANPSDKPRLLALLRTLPNISVFEGDQIPAQVTHPTRTGDVVVTTEPPYTLGRADSMTDKLLEFARPLLNWHAGAHGYSPDLPDMGGIFFAMGRGVDHNKTLKEVTQLQVAPTITELLDIEPPPNASATPIELN